MFLFLYKWALDTAKSMKKHYIIFFTIFVLLSVQSYASRKESHPFDATDDIENQARSGLVILVDHQTGCEYLGTLLGGPTPRMAEDGKTQLGCGNVSFDAPSQISNNTWRELNY